MVRQDLIDGLRRGAFAALVLLAACTTPAGDRDADPGRPPPAPREFRAAWVASVANIDWPSRRDLSTAQQQAEIVAILDRARDLNLNAIVLQVRPSADAIYPSALEPWSEYLTGEQGQPPQPLYDPLQSWIEEARARNIEIHAWFNPYRARHSQAKSANAANHVSNTHPAIVKTYGGMQWLDPGEPAAAQRTLDVILDVVRRYDIDGVHIDDYFYPYPVALPGSVPPAAAPDDTPQPREELPFPDDAAWQRYLGAGGTLARADWRRDNVNRLVEAIYTGIKREKPWVKFGISPFGLGKPAKRPPGIAGFSQYDKLYADAELWFNRGWLDYFTPQLYWPIDQKAQSFVTLLDYWAGENAMRRHLWPGLYLTRINDTDKSWQPVEILNQIGAVRDRARGDAALSGQVHFSMIGLMQNRKGIGDALRDRHYVEPALVPASPWLGREPLSPPRLAIEAEGERVSIGTIRKKGDAARRYAIWTRIGGSWHFRSEFAGADEAAASVVRDIFRRGELPEAVVWSAIDRYGNEGPFTRLMKHDILEALGGHGR